MVFQVDVMSFLLIVSEVRTLSPLKWMPGLRQRSLGVLFTRQSFCISGYETEFTRQMVLGLMASHTSGGLKQT